ncbi:hypothetical protein G3T14_05415 [Methylobacterium sp. BTF04]|uniref:hypothetical protein n=1 Tax=Methylobacterium sp. BTF04 TaxID=2708300 RepID=UPI0013D607A9|nr:hypothetical protein [Methylobacterium sp. BTF04]NEU11565.1 hypothetical protein [Methylobacterium sp. BTF04]
MLNPEDLRIISEADYGQDSKEHLAALRSLLHGGALNLRECKPTEVLELTRWDRPIDDPTHIGRHWRRAFACATLLRAYGEPENDNGAIGANETLVSLIDSLHALGLKALRQLNDDETGDINRAAAALVAWLIPRLGPNSSDEAAFFGLGLLWFALAENVSDAALVALMDWIMVAEAEAATAFRAQLGYPIPGEWLLGTIWSQQCHDLWRRLGGLLPGRLSAWHGAEVVSTVHLIAAMLTRDPED